MTVKEDEENPTAPMEPALVPATEVPATAVPATPGLPAAIEVEAPSALPGGYEMMVEQDGRKMMITVPAGGVDKGQVFTAAPRPAPEGVVVETPVNPQVKNDGQPPRGHWRNGLCDCFNMCCLPVCWWSSLFGGAIMIGQLMTRMGYDMSCKYVGVPYPASASLKPFHFMIGVAVVYIVGSFIPTGIVGLAAVIVALVYGIQLRTYMRQKYEIPGSCFEDCCCLFWCGPCTLCQMSNHTHEMVQYGQCNACCNETGLVEGAPIVV